MLKQKKSWADTKQNNQVAKELFVATERNAKLRYKSYKKLSEL